MKKLSLGTSLLIIVLLLVGFDNRDLPQEQEDDRPNILVIISDDQRYDTLEYMPRTQELIFDQGMTFTNAYIPTSRCCPSRSSIFTGMYAHTHNVRVNADPLRKPTMVEHLDDVGYYTGIVGKYLNSYPLPEDNEPRPEFDRWVVMATGSNAAYFDTRINIDGEWIKHEGYQTYLLRDYAIDFFRDAHEQDEPFFLQFSPYAPHSPALPAPEDEELFSDLPLLRPPNFNPADMEGKPQWLQDIEPLNEKDIEVLDVEWPRRIQTLQALDRSIEEMLNELEELGELDNTLIVYLSDNGIMLGEHRLPLVKVYAYQESVHVPFGIRYPPMVAAQSVEDRLVANIDIAPTVYDLVGIPVPRQVDGRSLVPLFTGEADNWRDYLLIEGWPVDVSRVPDTPFFIAAHSGDMIYIETEGDISEFYDMTTDPYQLQNLIDDPAYTDDLARHQAYLDEIRGEITRPPFWSGASKLKLVNYIESFKQWWDGFWYTYRYSKKLWGGVGLVILILIAFWKRERIRGFIAEKRGKT